LEDRWSKLAIDAHVSGALDFKNAHRFDYIWLLKEKVVLDSIENKLATNINQLNHLWHCSAAQITGWDENEELFEYHKKQVQKAYNVIGMAYLPWYKQWTQVEDKPIEQVWKEFQERGKEPKYAAYLKTERQRLRQLANEVDIQAQRSKDFAVKMELDAKQKKKANVDRKARRDRARLHY
jgi:hypothetical protein